MQNDLASKFTIPNTELLDLFDQEIEKLHADSWIAVVKTKNDFKKLLNLEQQAKTEQIKVAKNNPSLPENQISTKNLQGKTIQLK